MASDDSEPKWLDEENDQSHQDEVAPLFGTGSLSLQDDSDEEDPGQTSTVKLATGSNYGTVKPEEDDTTNQSVVTGTTAGSAGSSKKSSRIVVLESGKPERPPRNCFLAFFHFIEAFGVVTSLCLMATQLMPIVLIPFDEMGAMSLVLKIYISLFSFLFVLLEWDAPIPFLRNATFLQKYFSRGFLYSFLGLSCLEEAYSERVNDMVAHAKDQFHVSWFSLFMQISSWMMVGLGFSYMLLGLCCMKNLRDRMVQDYREQWEVYRDAMNAYKANKEH